VHILFILGRQGSSFQKKIYRLRTTEGDGRGLAAVVVHERRTRMWPMSGTESNRYCRRVFFTRTTFAFALLLPLFSITLTSWAQSTSAILGSATDASGTSIKGLAAVAIGLVPLLRWVAVG
jgi:hypothetical protein